MNKYPAPTLGVAAMAAALLSFLAPITALGQQSVADGHADPAGVNRDITVATQLRAEAAELYSASPKHWGRVIDLHARAARVAGVDDQERVQDLWMAGIVSAARERPAQAQRYLTQAAEAALEFGDLFKAGEAFILAAVAAAKSGDRPEARHLLTHANLMSESALLPDDMCDCLKSRIAVLQAALN